MNYSNLSGFLAKNFFFSFLIILISFTMGWIFYNRIFLKGNNIKNLLSDKDSSAVWIELIGSFICPVLFLSSQATAGPASNNFFVDFLVCLVYSIIYIILFIAMKYVANRIIPLSSIEGKIRRINLNDEIYNNRNIAASLYSVMLSYILANMIILFDIDTDYLVTSLLRISNLLIFTLIGYILYRLFLNRKAAILKEIFAEKNIAESISLLGFISAVQYLIMNTIILQTDFSFIGLLLVSIINLAVLCALSVLFKYIIAGIIKVNFGKEVLLHSNIFSAIGQSAIYIGIASVISGYMR